jgi:hypothetical protein
VLRDIEAKAEAKRLALIAELAADGIDISALPDGELEKAAEEMEGPWLKWHRSLKKDREGGRDEVADKKEELLSRILGWRDRTAAELCMAPGSVITEGVARKIAYAQITEESALVTAGRR